MKKYIFHSLAIALLCACGFGCGPKSTGSSPGSAGVKSDNWEMVKLTDGTEVLCWVSNTNHAGDASLVWCNAKTGPVSYRIIGQSVDWQPMTKIKESADGKHTVITDPDGKFGAQVVLPRGIFAVEFKIGNQVSPKLRLPVY